MYVSQLCFPMPYISRTHLWQCVPPTPAQLPQSTGIQPGTAAALSFQLKNVFVRQLTIMAHLRLDGS